MKYKINDVINRAKKVIIILNECKSPLKLFSRQLL